MTDPVRTMPAALEVRHLSFRYDDGRAALSDISFAVQPGECVGLLGPNGAGKSTLLLHLNGILPERLPARTAPAVIVDGLPLDPGSLPAVRQRVGLMFQQSDDQLFCPTVWEDVAFGPRQGGLRGEVLGERVRACLERVNLHGFEHRRPHGLSQGEKRRVCLAGVLACEPGVLVLDEPTSDLDPRGRREFKDLLRERPGDQDHRHARPGTGRGTVSALAAARRRRADRRRPDSGPALRRGADARARFGKAAHPPTPPSTWGCLKVETRQVHRTTGSTAFSPPPPLPIRLQPRGETRGLFLVQPPAVLERLLLQRLPPRVEQAADRL